MAPGRSSLGVRSSLQQVRPLYRPSPGQTGDGCNGFTASKCRAAIRLVHPGTLTVVTLAKPVPSPLLSPEYSSLVWCCARRIYRQGSQEIASDISSSAAFRPHRPASLVSVVCLILELFWRDGLWIDVHRISFRSQCGRHRLDQSSTGFC
jgi:hypothetical protein